jgi:hypothetical protein
VRIPALILIGILACGAAGHAAPKSARDPQAMAALDRMGAALRALKSFSVSADVTDEDVLTDGQKVQYLGKILLRAQMPNALRIDAASDRKTRTIYYNGKSLTIFAPKKGLYASFDAPPTIHQLIDDAQRKYGLEVPLADLFAWGTNAAKVAAISSALPVGSDTVDGAECDHFAMRQPDVDWQIWIRHDGAALPCRYVITSTDDSARPQYGVVLHWDTQTAPAPDTYTFTPPAGALKIGAGKAEGNGGPVL